MHSLSCILMLFALSPSLTSGIELTCHPPEFTCPDSPVSCVCEGSQSIQWEVRLTSAAPESEPLFLETFTATSLLNESSRGNFTALLCNVTEEPPRFGVIPVTLTSKLNFMFMGNVTVVCRDNRPSPDTAILQGASSPSPSLDLGFTQICTATGGVAVRLDWDPPLNDGGVAITNYLIFVNGSEEMSSTSTSVTLTLNSMGQHLIEIGAVNDCGLSGDRVSVIIQGDTDSNVPPLMTTTADKDTGILSTTISTSTAETRLLTLSTGAVVGLVISLLVVIATAYTSGLLTGLLVWRKKSHATSASGDLSAPTYEQVLPPTQTSISLKENEAYGHFNS